MNKDNPRNLNILKENPEFAIEIERYSNKLEENELPVIYSLKHFSELIGIEHKKLKSIIATRENFYKTFQLKKRNNNERNDKVRIINVPSYELKYIQRMIYNNILKNIDLDDSCVGFRADCSIKDNALPHINKEAILKFDLLDFFNTINEKRVFGVFKSLGYIPNLAYDFAKLTTVPISQDESIESMDINGIEDFLFKKDENVKRNIEHEYSVLPQGAPTSPMLSNIIAKNLDLRLRILAEKNNLSYTRYADDITFSGDISNLPSRKFIQRIIEDEGFVVNHNKTKFRKQGQRQIVTGLTVTNNMHVPKQFKQEIKKHLYYCKKYGVKDHLIKTECINKVNYSNWLLGKIMHVRNVEPKIGRKFLDEYNEIDWSI